jgi:hypothetical protein
LDLGLGENQAGWNVQPGPVLGSACLPFGRYRGRFGRNRRVGPLQEAQGQFQVAVYPGPNCHGPAGIVKALAPIPLEHIGIAFEAIAGEAGWHTVFCDAQAAPAARHNVVNRFGWFAAINARLIGVIVERLSPASDAKFRAQIFKENRIPGVHPIVSVAVILA